MDLREQILSIDDLGGETVLVPHWNKEVFVRGLSALERDKIFKRGSDEVLDFADASLNLVIACTLDPKTKEPIFKSEDKLKLGKKHWAAIELLETTILRISGLSADSRITIEKN